MSTWKEALKEYSANKQFVIPKKGTKEYDEVKQIQEKITKQNFKPHKMYEPKTGKAVKADTKGEHEKLGQKGYTHKAPKKKGGTGVEVMFKPLFVGDDSGAPSGNKMSTEKPYEQNEGIKKKQPRKIKI